MPAASIDSAVIGPVRNCATNSFGIDGSLATTRSILFALLGIIRSFAPVMPHTQIPGQARQHIFHRRYEGAVRLGRNDPALLAVGLDNVFFKTRPIVLSLARSTMLNSTTFSSSNRKLQRANPSGGSEHASAISLASFSPSKIGATGGAARTLRLNTASNPSSTSCLRTQ